MIRIAIETSAAKRLHRTVASLLAAVPVDDLAGIDEICLLETLSDRRISDARALYFPAHDGRRARIEISVPAVFAGFPKSARWLPILSTLILGRVLYHEIGHHSLRVSHGYSRQAQERRADKYAKEMLARRFRALRPFRVIIKLVARALDALSR